MAVVLMSRFDVSFSGCRRNQC